MNAALSLLKQCKEAHIELEVVGHNKLSYTCPKGALTDDLKKQIIEFKPSIIKRLARKNQISAICGEYGITVNWLNQFVVCPVDILDLESGFLTLPLLRSHIEYHLERQKDWPNNKPNKSVFIP